MGNNDSLTITSAMNDAYVVRIMHTDEKTGERKENTDVIPRVLFEAMVRTSYLRWT